MISLFAFAASFRWNSLRDIAPMSAPPSTPSEDEARPPSSKSASSPQAHIVQCACGLDNDRRRVNTGNIKHFQTAEFALQTPKWSFYNTACCTVQCIVPNLSLRVTDGHYLWKVPWHQARADKHCHQVHGGLGYQKDDFPIAALPESRNGELGHHAQKQDNQKK